MNSMFMAKLGWRILKDHALWVRVLKGKYFSSRSIWVLLHLSPIVLCFREVSLVVLLYCNKAYMWLYAIEWLHLFGRATGSGRVFFTWPSNRPIASVIWVCCGVSILERLWLGLRFYSTLSFRGGLQVSEKYCSCVWCKCHGPSRMESYPQWQVYS